ncbi:MAG: tRNA (uridine(34)/cytosine(34)/5-carboxymethylaminomethyluridine(34)-2'-O)-methyltransferase TrmL [Halobacteriovorax sp.]|nr:tRNA (uridine(34)/cytosine(34)/5-carboxymethylaminomethyluridine(34)-2'-O)-methyltransferase TrmL [Halobacteriovorax sp.]
MFNIVLVAPEIPGNTGSIGRTCLALGARLHLVRPYGFSLDEKEVRRAGLDYWKHVDLVEYDSIEEVLEKNKPEQIFYFSKKATKPLFEAKFNRGCFLVFGKETAGLDDDLMEKNKERLLTLPIYSDHVRSLNLSNAATAVAYEALRQINFN